MQEEFKLVIQRLINDNSFGTRVGCLFRVGVEIAEQWPGFYDMYDARKASWNDSEPIERLLAQLGLVAGDLIDLDSTEEERAALYEGPEWLQPLSIDQSSYGPGWNQIEEGIARLHRKVMGLPARSPFQEAPQNHSKHTPTTKKEAVLH
jgi:hypothetical protein